MIDRTIAPDFHPIQVHPLKNPEVQRFQNGGQLALFMDSNQHLVSVEMIFPAHNLSARKRQADAYSFKMLLEGTTTRDSKKIADDISFLGASFDISHSAEADSISISCLSRFLPQLVDILKSLWTDGVFPEKEWKTMQETGTQQNAINLQKTSYLASRLLRGKLFGVELDYGYSFDSEFVQSLTAEKLKSNFRENQKTGPAMTLVSGWAEPEGIQSLNTWISSFDQVGRLPENSDYTLPEVVSGQFWDSKPDSQQTSIRIGKPTINNRHPDSARFSLMLEIFGGYFGSRLMSNIREDKGWTYGIFAQRVSHRAAPYLLISSDLNGESALLALEEIRKESQILRTEPVGEEELEKVKNYVLGQFLTSITNCFGLADMYRSVWQTGTDFERVYKNALEIQSSTSVHVLEMAYKYLNLEDAIVAFSGNPIKN